MTASPESHYVPRMREQSPTICWRVLTAGEECCILDRGHDDGEHEVYWKGTIKEPAKPTTREHTPWGCDLILCNEPVTIAQRKMIRNGLNLTSLEGLCIQNHLLNRLDQAEARVTELEEALETIKGTPTAQLAYLHERGLRAPDTRYNSGDSAQLPSAYELALDHESDARGYYPAQLQLVDAVARAALAHVAKELE